MIVVYTCWGRRADDEYDAHRVVDAPRRSTGEANDPNGDNDPAGPAELGPAVELEIAAQGTGNCHEPFWK